MLNMINITQNTLSNGLKIYMDKAPYFDSVLVAVMVKCGSGQENSKNNGVAHFLEHMMFKGTKKRSAKEISESIESVGGEINAFTSKEKTMYYIKVLKEDVLLAIDVLADFIQDSVFDAEEIEKERGVILQELASSLDTPSDVVFDYFAEGVFGPNSSLGRSVLGKAETIKSITRDDITGFLESYYSADNMIVGVVGNFDEGVVVDAINKSFTKLKTGLNKKEPEKSPYAGVGVDIRTKENLEQVQFVLGVKGASSKDFEQKYKLSVIANAIGGGMSSMFFQEIREKRGLAYSVGCFSDSYEQGGVFGLYAATDASKLNDMIDAVSFCFKKAADDIEQGAITRAIKQYQAGMLMRQESLSARMSKMLTDFLMYGRYVEADEIMSYIANIAPNQAAQILEKTISSEESLFTLVLYGDFREKEVVDRLGRISQKDLLK